MPQSEVASSFSDESNAGLPEKPIVSIRPAGRWAGLDLRSLWAYRELLYFLTWRDIKVRYKQTAIGSAWAIAQPLLTMVVFTLLFGRLAGIPSDGIPYPLFVYSGLLPWIFFSASITRGTQSLVGSANLITKVYFPRLIIPGSAIAAGLLDFLVGFGFLIVLLVWYRVPPTPGLLMLPVIIFLITLCALAVGVLLSAVNVRYRDISYVIPFAVQLLMFATPIIYPVSIVPDPWRRLLTFNPLVGLLEAFRASLFGRPINHGSLGMSALVSILLLVAGAFYFRRIERSFADIV